ncbi:hypothetical protein T4B_2575 [Trichinella pseudospiralis]|uniref:Uncharacterized protein n=1 Tax=Trichinella pseudospiralis TaxID=6337 RepID=A0A0V1GXU9_TRIPS|nr:hypothetical protein T4B_2575 [Trichinella pseudospiralis]
MNRTVKLLLWSMILWDVSFRNYVKLRNAMLFISEIRKSANQFLILLLILVGWLKLCDVVDCLLSCEMKNYSPTHFCDTSHNVYQIQIRSLQSISESGAYVEKICQIKAKRLKKTKLKHTANSLAFVHRLTSRLLYFLLLNNVRTLAKHHQLCLLLRKIRVRVVVGHLPCQMEMDTGSEFIVSEYIF